MIFQSNNNALKIPVMSSNRIVFGNHAIEQINCTKYLGVMIDDQ